MSQRVWRPQKPKIGLLEPPPPPFDPILGHFVWILVHFGVKKHTLFKKTLGGTLEVKNIKPGANGVKKPRDHF